MGRTTKGKKVPKKYLTKDATAMKKEIDKFSDSNIYKKDWDADYSSGKGGKGKRYKTKKSTSTKVYHKMFGECVTFEEFITEGSVDDKDSVAGKMIATKSKQSGIPKFILKQVYKRGMAAWNSGHRPGTPQEAWATGRVNSFITGKGGARDADNDLWKKVKKK